MPGDRLEDGADVLDRPSSDARRARTCCLRGLEDAVEPAQDDERQDDLPVLGLLVVAAQQVGDRPDEAGVVVDCGSDLSHLRPPAVVLLCSKDSARMRVVGPKWRNGRQLGIALRRERQ